MVKTTFLAIGLVGAMLLCNSYAVIVALFGFFANMRIGMEYDYIPFESLFATDPTSFLLLPPSDNKTVTDMFYGFCMDHANPESRKCFPAEEASQHLVITRQVHPQKTLHPKQPAAPLDVQFCAELLTICAI